MRGKYFKTLPACRLLVQYYYCMKKRCWKYTRCVRHCLAAGTNLAIRANQKGCTPSIINYHHHPITILNITITIPPLSLSKHPKKYHCTSTTKYPILPTITILIITILTIAILTILTITILTITITLRILTNRQYLHCSPLQLPLLYSAGDASSLFVVNHPHSRASDICQT